jgi:hypothetical protein
MKKFLCLLLVCIGCSSAPPPAKTPVEAPCPQLPPAPTCEDKVIVMDEKGASCPANTRATFPSPFGFFQPGKIVVLCQCK